MRLPCFMAVFILQSATCTAGSRSRSLPARRQPLRHATDPRRVPWPAATATARTEVGILDMKKAFGSTASNHSSQTHSRRTLAPSCGFLISLPLLPVAHRPGMVRASQRHLPGSAFAVLMKQPVLSVCFPACKVGWYSHEPIYSCGRVPGGHRGEQSCSSKEPPEMHHALTKICCSSTGETQLKAEVPFSSFWLAQVSVPPWESREALKYSPGKTGRDCRSFHI